MKYLRNFYNNVIRGTKAEKILHLPGFWITLIFTFLCFVSYDNKEFFLTAGILVYLMYKLNGYLNEKNKLDKASIYFILRFLLQKGSYMHSGNRCILLLSSLSPQYSAISCTSLSPQ